MRLLYEPLTDIPISFKEVEYLESSGTQYIDTGFIPTENTRTIAKLYTEETGNKNWFGCGNQNTNYAYCFNAFSTTQVEYIFGDNNGDGQWRKPQASAVGIPFIIDFSKNGIVINNSVITSDMYYNTFGTGILTMTLFVRNGGSAYIKGKVYYLQMYDNGTLVRDFVPCLDKNNVPCLWDRVEGKAYYNQGTGDFTYGRQIIPVEYLEGTGTQYIDTGIVPTNRTGVYAKMSYTDVNNKVTFGSMVSGNGFVGPYYASTSTHSGWWTRWGTSEPRASASPTAGTIYEFFMNFNNDRVARVDNTIIASSLGTISGTFPNMTLFRRNFSSGYAYLLGKIYAAKMTDGSTLVRDFIPCKDENNVGFMFDKATHTIYDNAGTGSFLVGKVKKKKKLRIIYDWNNRVPRGFKEVEYIQSSGTQYIDTGFIPTGNTGIDMRFLITGRGSGGNDSNMIMAGGDSAGYRCGFGYRSSSDNTYGHTLQVSGICATGSSWENYAMASKVPHTVLYNYDNQKKCYLDGVLKRENIPYGTATVTYPMFIFSSNMNGTSWRTSSFKLYYCKIVDNGVLVRDFIPCLDSNNVPCLWDTVTKQAYYNQGTGDFTYGSQIIPVKYLESTGTQYINTGVILTNNHSVEIDYQLTSASQNRKGIFGGLTTSRYGALLSPSNNYLEFGYGSSNIWYQTGLPDTNRHTMYQKKNELYFDGVLINTFTDATFTQTATSPLGNFNYTNYNPASAKYYSSKWWDGDILVRDYIPVKDENDVGYMFDTISHSLYANAGTGSFVVGEQLKNTIRFIEDGIPNIAEFT